VPQKPSLSLVRHRERNAGALPRLSGKAKKTFDAERRRSKKQAIKVKTIGNPARCWKGWGNSRTIENP